MSTKAPTLRQFQDRFPTEESCLEHLFRVRFGNDTECGKCGRPARYTRVASRRSYQCQWCAFQVYPTAGTPFHRTRTSLRDWFFVMFQFCASRNGVAAKEVQRQIGVTYKTAWRMCHEIRIYMGQVDGNEGVGGPGTTVEIDETMIGGHRRGVHYRHTERPYVIGMVERGGDVVTAVVSDVKRSTLLPHVVANVAPGGDVQTDSLHSYKVLGTLGYTHTAVNHNKGEYVSRSTGAHTQTIEGFWANLKRGINGTYIHVSTKHLPKYLAEFEFRYNLRQTPHLMLDRLLLAFPR